MPPLPRLRITALAEYARQTRYLLPEAALAQLARTQSLALEVLRDVTRQAPGSTGIAYPESWVMGRIIGVPIAPSSADDADGTPVMLPGDALLGDCAALIELLSRASARSMADVDGDAVLTLAQLAARWRVSTKSIARYRRAGLIAWRVRATLLPGAPKVSRSTARRGRTPASHRASMHEVLVFPVTCVEAFEAARPDVLASAAGFSRIDPATCRRIVARAERYQRAFNWSLAQCAQRLAQRFRRSPRAVVRVLERAATPRGASSRASGRGSRLTEIEAAWLALDARGHLTPPARLARRFSISAATLHRLLAQARMHRLRATMPPAAQHVDASSLNAPAARESLGRPFPDTAAAILAQCDSDAVPRRASLPPPPLAIERDISLAMRAARARAVAGFETLHDSSPAISILDRVETDLRWASRLKAELVRMQLPLMIRTIRSLAPIPLESMPDVLLTSLMAAGLRGLMEAADLHDPSKGGRLAAPATICVTRAVTHTLKDQTREHVPNRATGIAARLGDFSRRLDDWQPALEPAAHGARDALRTLPEPLASLARARLGWWDDAAPGECQPRTLEEAAAMLGLTRIKAARLERAWRAELHRA